MQMQYSSSEVKSGLFIVFSLVLLMALTFIVGNYLGGEKSVWKVRFGYICGLEDNSPVYYAGREVGKVENIEILRDEERPVLLTVRIANYVRLREDSQAYIDTLGMMGEKFVELTPGTKAAAFLNPGKVIEGEDPVPMHKLVTKMNLLADRMDELTVSLNPLMQRTDNLLKGNEENIAKIISNLEETSANVRDMTHDLKFRPWRLVRKG